MRINLFRILPLLVLLLSSTFVIAQYSANSPYSRLGLGDPVDNNFMSLRSMGGIGASYIDPYNINVVNPASYGFLDVTSFDMGVFAKYSSLSDNTQSEGLWNGNLAYISIAFPLTNPINEILDRVERSSSWGMNFSLMPHTSVGYNITSIDTLENIGGIEEQFRGSGGTYKFLWGNSYRYKNISGGINLGYLFGKISYQRDLYFTETQGAYDNQFITDYSVNGFIWNAGVIYQMQLNKEKREKDRNIPAKWMSIGLHGNSKSSFETESTILNQAVSRFGTTASVDIDTISFENGIIGRGNLPAEIGVGATYYNGQKSSIGFAYTNTFWSGYKNEANDVKLSNSYKVSLGGFLRPDYKSFTSYFKRIAYRWGLYYGTDPRLADDDQITNYGASFGFGLPFIYQRKISHANLGLEIGRRGQGSPIKESFATINFSFTFNDDEWFIKRKYD